MHRHNIALGLDFGTESVRCLAARTDRAETVTCTVVPYAHGVVTGTLPKGGRSLPPDFALQWPGDYLDAATTALRSVLSEVDAEAILGIGVDFTACTLLPVTAEGMPLAEDPEFQTDPHAWVKLWKHHGAEAEAEAVNRVAASRNEPFLPFIGGRVSSEWMIPKCWETRRHAPRVYQAAARFVEAGDWVVEQMTGVVSKNATAAGYKGFWTHDHGFPTREFLDALEEGLSTLLDKWAGPVVAPGTRVGGVTQAFADRTGLRVGTPVAAATIDAHSGVAGMGVAREGVLSVILGTSACHMLLSRNLRLVTGVAGIVKDGILPGFFGYESGQAAVGDLFGWWAQTMMGGEGPEAFAELSARAARLAPGETGLLALDWINGCRTPLMDSRLSASLIGITLGTEPHHVYRALIEGAAFGTRAIVALHEVAGLPIEELVVCGGLVKDDLILSVFADVCGRPVRVAESDQAVALGAAILGAVAGEVPDADADVVVRRVATMTQDATVVHLPDPSRTAIYDSLFSIYCGLSDHFGVVARDLMHQLKSLRAKSLDRGEGS